MISLRLRLGENSGSFGDYHRRHDRNDAEGLVRRFRSLKTAFMTTLWSFLLHRFKTTSCHLQAVDIDLCALVGLYESLIVLVQKCRDDFDEFERQTIQKGNTQYTVCRFCDFTEDFYKTSFLKLNVCVFEAYFTNGLIILQNLFRQLLTQNNFCNWGIQCTLKTHIEREEGKCKTMKRYHLTELLRHVRTSM
jgi:hypothetical protein